MSDLDVAVVTTHTDLVACLEQLWIRADSPSYRDLEQRTSKLSGSKLPGTGLKRVRLGRSAIGGMLRGSAFPKKAFLLTFVEACGVDAAADRRWADAWDRLSERYAKRTGQAQIELAQLRAEIARLHAEVIAEHTVAEKALAEKANFHAQLAAARQNAEKDRLEALRQLNRTQQQLSDTQSQVTRLREEVKELAEQLRVQERQAAHLRDPAPAAADLPIYQDGPAAVFEHGTAEPGQADPVPPYLKRPSWFTRVIFGTLEYDRNNSGEEGTMSSASESPASSGWLDYEGYVGNLT